MHGVLPQDPTHRACRLHRRPGSVGVAMPTDVVALTASEAARVAFVTVGDGPDRDRAALRAAVSTLSREAAQSLGISRRAARREGRYASSQRMSSGRVRIGQLQLDPVTFDQALERIAKLVDGREGGSVFTPNVDHVVKAETNDAFRGAYERADLCLVDGTWLLWASRLLDTPLPEKVSGSDLVGPLCTLAAGRRWRVYLLGGGPGVAGDAAARMSGEFGVDVVGWDSPFVQSDGSMGDSDAILGRLREAEPDLVLIALGAPKQELWMDRFSGQIAPAVSIGVGGSLDFLTGRVRRAPPWMSRCGLEWMYRLVQEPRRMWRRYLVDDPRFVAIVVRSWRNGRRSARS